MQTVILARKKQKLQPVTSDLYSVQLMQPCPFPVKNECASTREDFGLTVAQEEG